MAGLSDDVIIEYREAFSLFDKVGDGKIEAIDLGELLRALGENPTEAEVKKILQEIDPKGNKRISFEEFLPILNSQSQRRHKVAAEEFIEGFKVFDRDGNGTVQSAELRHVLTGLGEKMVDAEVDVLIQGLEDKQGSVNYEEFVKLVLLG